MAINAELSKCQVNFKQKNKSSIKGNVSVDVYMYYHAGVYFSLNLKL
jgi:hypothetical protein